MFENDYTPNKGIDPVAIRLWKQLGDVPINDGDEIEEEFLHFEEGTDRFTIWHWFEETYNCSIATDLSKFSY